MKLIEKHLGAWGRYQGLFYALLFLPGVISGCQTLLFSFTGAVPEHRCFVDGIDDNDAPNFNVSSVLSRSNLFYYSSEKEGGKKVFCKQCLNAAEPQVLRGLQDRTDNCTADEAQECAHGHIYDRSQYKSSLAMKFNMVCDDHWKRDLAKSMFMVGKLLGSLIFGILSDIFGRRPIFLFCSMIGIVTFNVVPVLPTFWLICIFQIINGTVTYGAYLTAFVFVMELVGGAYRTVCGVMVQAFYTVGYIFVGVVAYFLRDWTHIQWVVSSPVFLLIPYYWLIPESIRWQIVHGKTEDAFKSIKKVAKLNGIDLNEAELRADLATAAEESKHEKSANVIRLFRFPVLAMHTCIVLFTWLAVAMTYYGISYNTDDLPGSIYVNFILHGLVEFPGLILCIILMEKIGRRLALSIMMSSGGLCFIISACIPEGNPMALNVMALIGKALIVGAFAIVYNYSAEFYPTVVRQSGTGISSVFGRFGSISAPQIHVLHKTLGLYVPMLIYGSFSFAAGILDFFLPETKGMPMPETIDDAASRPMVPCSSQACCQGVSAYKVNAKGEKGTTSETNV